MERQMQFVEDRINKLGEELIQIEADMDQSRLTKLKSFVQKNNHTLNYFN